MSKWYDRVKVLTLTTGSGTVSLGPAAFAFRTFAQAGVPDGQTLHYLLEDVGDQAEVGVGVYNSTTGTLTRAPTWSTNSTPTPNSPIELSGGAFLSITATSADFDSFVDKATSQELTGQKTWSSGFIRFSHDDETGTFDGRIGAAIVYPGLNIYGVQTTPGSGRIVTLVGDTRPAIDSTYDLGHATFKWRVGYFDSISVGGSIPLTGVPDQATAEAGVDNGSIMTPLRTKQAISALVTNGSSWEINSTTTGSSQIITLPETVSAANLLVFVNGVEQAMTGVTQSGPAQITLDARTAGMDIRVVRMGGPMGRSIEPNATGNLAGRTAYDGEDFGFVYLLDTDSRGEFYLNRGDTTWAGPFYLQGLNGNPGAAGANALSPWTKKSATFTVADKGRYLLDTSAGSFFVDLPTGAIANGFEFWVMGDFVVFPAIVRRFNSGEKIDGIVEDFTLDVDRVCPKFTYWDGNWYLSL